MSDILYNLIRRKDYVPDNPVVVYFKLKDSICNRKYAH